MILILLLLALLGGTEDPPGSSEEVVTDQCAPGVPTCTPPPSGLPSPPTKRSGGLIF